MTLTCTPTLNNNTISLNHSVSTSYSAQGAGIYAYSGSSCAGKNNIIYSNVATSNADFWGVINMQYSCTGSFLSGVGNTQSNPLFINVPLEGYCLLSHIAAGQTSNSPLIDAGDPVTPMLDGSTRSDFVQDTGVIDMGYHWTTSFSNWFDIASIFDEEFITAVEDLVPVSSDIAVSNYPNPFNPATTVNLTMNQPGEMELVVIDVTGRIVSVLYNGYLQSGVHQFEFSGQNLSTGIYFYQAKSGGNIVTGKALLIK
ncbi:MAG: T9SS type A sorting domain-containing protein [FCB group bacterium]|nr:T9SS type A sorting domain-containing protein [FCB group bacterium]